MSNSILKNILRKKTNNDDDVISNIFGKKLKFIIFIKVKKCCKLTKMKSHFYLTVYKMILKYTHQINYTEKMIY
jgi:hypothetical protein